MTQLKQPTGRFCDLGIEKSFLSVLTQKEFNIPTPIQHQVIPGALEGKDVIGVAQTGTGKTLAFGIPMIQRLALYKGQGLVIVPTRELALQVEQAFKNIGGSFGLRCAAIIGGSSKKLQINALRRNPHIIIATPGRLIDLMNQGLYKLDDVNTITLDEADRMLDIGFLPDIKRILKAAPTDRQTMLFSATMPQSITSLASEFMKTPIKIEVTPQGTTAENVEHEVFVKTGWSYYYTGQKLFMVGSHPLIRCKPGIPMSYESRGWDFGWLMVRTDGRLFYRRCDPYTLTFKDIEQRHPVRWFVC